LKSKLLLPEPESEGEPSAEELAERLTLQLQRLEAIRMAATRLMSRDRLGSDVFLRGAPEGIRVIKTPRYADTLLDLLKAYAAQRVKKIAHSNYELQRLAIFAIEDARHRLEKMLGVMIDWSTIDMLVPQEFSLGQPRRTGIASTLSASLEMARDGLVELRQMAPFAPLYVRARTQQESEKEVPT
jgi:segregation and condensation protein A